jgi:hypothetical protein
LGEAFEPGTPIRIVRCGCRSNGAGPKVHEHAGSHAIVNFDVPERRSIALPMPRLILSTVLPGRDSGCIALEAEALT